MVRQFWIWLAGNWVISAYTPPDKDAEHAMDGKVRAQMSAEAWRLYGLGEKRYFSTTCSPEHHIIRLLADQVRCFGEIQGIEKFESPLDIFEIGVSRVLTSAYVKDNDLPTDDSTKEIQLMSDIVDIRDELNMVDEILQQQETVLYDFITHIGLVQPKKQDLRRSKKQTKPVVVSEMLKEIALLRTQIKNYRIRVSKILRDAKRVEKMVQDRLNAKRTFAAERDARASIDDAKASLLLARAVIGFTVITILFAPLAFMTALFALNIEGLAKHKLGKGDNAAYPSRYIIWTFCKFYL